MTGRDIRARASAGFVLLGIRYAACFVLNLGGSVVLARALGVDGWGMFALAYFFMGTFAYLSLGVWGYLVQSPDEPGRKDIACSFLLQQVLGGGWAVALLVLVGPALETHFGEPVLRPMIAGAALGGYFHCWRWMTLALAERRMDYATVSVAEIVDAAVFNCVAVAGAFSGHAVAGVSAGLALRGVASAAYAVLRVRPALGLSADPAAMKRVVRFGGPFLVFTSLLWLPVQLGPVLVGFLVSPRALGLVSLAYRLLEYPRVMVTMVFRVSMSALSEIGRLSANGEDLNRALAEGLGVLFHVLSPAMVVFSVFAPLWVPAIFGPSFRPAGEIVLVAGVPFALGACHMFLATGLSAGGRSGTAALCQAVYNVFYWTGAALLIPRLRHMGLPVNEWVALPAIGVLLYAHHRSGGRLPYVGYAAKAALMTLVAAAGWWLLRDGRAVGAAATAGVAAAFLLVWLWMSRKQLGVIRGSWRSLPGLRRDG